MTRERKSTVVPAKCAGARREMQYIGFCLMCAEEKVRAMIRRSRQITLDTARRAISPAVFDAWALSMDCATGTGGRERHLKTATSVTCHRSHYDVLPCVYIVHSENRHIFI